MFPSIISIVQEHAARDPQGQPARLLAAAAQLAPSLASAGAVAVSADNGEAWLVADLATLLSCKAAIPLPHFFSAAQVQWAVDSAGADTLLTDRPELPHWQALGFRLGGQQGGLAWLTRQCQPVDLPPRTAKITFTSGSTGHAKGVCLSEGAQLAVAGSIAGMMRELSASRHLCTLPLPVLLENVAGAYAALIADVECVLPSLAGVGWSGSSQWDARSFLQCVAEQRIESAIILPQMLKALLPLLGQYDTSSLRMVAVGGARVSAELLQLARVQGLPVYEGYGLSECSSVVCFNHPGADRPGTVGKPLPHAKVRINAEGELEVAGSHFLGYLGQPASESRLEWLPTGDLATIDADGFVSITGRRKHLLISSFGRNISPEWVESELLGQGGILQVAVFGEAKPWLSAVLFAPGLSDVALASAVAKANVSLPDYARVNRYVRATEPFTDANGLATSNGRNRRDAIASHFYNSLEALYSSTGELTA